MYYWIFFKSVFHFCFGQLIYIIASLYYVVQSEIHFFDQFKLIIMSDIFINFFFTNLPYILHNKPFLFYISLPLPFLFSIFSPSLLFNFYLIFPLIFLFLSSFLFDSFSSFFFFFPSCAKLTFQCHFFLRPFFVLYIFPFISAIKNILHILLCEFVLFNCLSIYPFISLFS